MTSKYEHPLTPYAACVECGNDDPCEGYVWCSDCLEAGVADDVPGVGVPTLGDAVT